jgi:hypothetical protein
MKQNTRQIIIDAILIAGCAIVAFQQPAPERAPMFIALMLVQIFLKQR